MLTLETRTQLTTQAKGWQTVLEQVKSFRVTDDASAETAAEFIRKAKTAYKEAEDHRTSITRPLLEAKNATDALFRPTKDALVAIERYLKGELGSYHAQREAQRVHVLIESAAHVAVGLVPTEPIPEAVAVQGVTVKQVWDFEVIDPDAVPRDLCSPDLDKIKARIWYANTSITEPLPIEGVRFFLNERVTVRG